MISRREIEGVFGVINQSLFGAGVRYRVIDHLELTAYCWKSGRWENEFLKCRNDDKYDFDVINPKYIVEGFSVDINSTRPPTPNHRFAKDASPPLDFIEQEDYMFVYIMLMCARRRRRRLV